ncbi:S-layer homology domain-containing protein, partial [Clostridium perfringens]
GSFQSYVKRSLNVDKAHALTDIAVVRVGGNGNEYTPLPFKVNGQRIDIYSRTNSTYLVLQNPVTFQDIATHWSKADVESLAAKMIVTGRTEQPFVPNASVTRAEFAALVVRAWGGSADAASGSCQDVVSSDWYAGAVQA